MWCGVIRTPFETITPLPAPKTRRRTSVSSTTQAQKASETLFVQFVVGRLSCALPLGDVHEIAAMVAVTPLPGAQRHVLGVIDYHGTPCTVLDLRSLLKLPGSFLEPDQHLLILRVGNRLLAVPCDQAERVLSTSMQPAPAGRKGGALIQGLIQEEDGVVLVLDPAQLVKGPQAGEVRRRRLARAGGAEAIRNEPG